MKLRQNGDPLDTLDELAPGVMGYAIEHDGAIYIPMVESVEPGKGNVGRFLDGLDRSRTWKFPTVISETLAGMLYRRGFKSTTEWAAEIEDNVSVWVLEKEKTANEYQDLDSMESIS